MPNSTELGIRLISKLLIRGFEDTMYNRTRPDDNAKQVIEAMECFAMNMKPQKLRKGFYYRARLIDTNDITEDKGFSFNEDGKIISGFNDVESGVAPKCIVKAGRINKEWESIWYLTNDAYTAMTEIRPSVREQVSVAKYRIVNNTRLNVLDFTREHFEMKEGFDKAGTALEYYDLNEIYVLMQSIVTLPSYNERTYYISNIVADIIKKLNVSGIKYTSFYGKGNNIAIWDVDDNAIQFCGSKVYLNYCINQAFISLEDGKTINNTTMFNSQIRKGRSKAISEAEKIYKERINRGRR